MREIFVKFGSLHDAFQKAGVEPPVRDTATGTETPSAGGFDPGIPLSHGDILGPDLAKSALGHREQRGDLGNTEAACTKRLQGPVAETRTAQALPETERDISSAIASDGKPIYTNDQIATFLATGYWQAKGYAPRKWAELDLAEEAPGVLYVDYSAMAANGRYFVERALAIWSASTGLVFSTDIPSGGRADISFDDSVADAAFAQTTYSAGAIRSVSINFADNWLGNSEGQLDSYTLQTAIHEIGHALGLGHPGIYTAGSGGTITYADSAGFANDSWQASVMSYFSQSQNSYVDASRAYALTPMVADILAVQLLYGVADTLRT